MDHSNLINMYRKSFEEHGDSDKAVFYPKGRQFIRYKNMLPIDLEGKKILDFGCGLAKLYRYLLENHPQSVECYTGVDIVPEFITQNKTKYKTATFLNISTLEDIESDVFDIIFVSGAFNVISQSKLEYKQYVLDTMSTLFEKCRYCLTIDFMHDNVDYQQDHAFHINISEIMNYIEANLSSRFIVNRSYLPYEISFTIYKNIRTDHLGVYYT